MDKACGLCHGVHAFSLVWMCSLQMDVACCVHAVIQSCSNYEEALKALIAASLVQNGTGGVKPDSGMEERTRKRKSGDFYLCGMPVKRAKTVVDDGADEPYKWSGLKDYGGRKAVDPSLMKDMSIIKLDEVEYEKYKSVLISINDELRSQKTVDWTSAGWTKNNLLENGFKVQSGPVMVAV